MFFLLSIRVLPQQALLRVSVALLRVFRSGSSTLCAFALILGAPRCPPQWSATTHSRKPSGNVVFDAKRSDNAEMLRAVASAKAGGNKIRTLADFLDLFYKTYLRFAPV
ncbi:hypothetical protein B0H13DRAFT_2328174 [Mycena leptocephala]|nr:hypothetical protein B0H13DRAFT_2328174 [Mycena leptocephala]